MSQPTGRRGVLLGAAALAGAAGLSYLHLGRERYVPVPGLPGFTRLEGVGGISGSPALAGIGGGAAVPELPEGDLCRQLYGQDGPEGAPRLAVFSDYNCPYCRQLTDALRGARGMRITWHEWPVLGPSSQLAARAALAARMQGAYDVFHARMSGSAFRPSPAYLRSLADTAGIDGARLLADMEGPEVQAQLALSRALAARMGLPGTPGMVAESVILRGTLGLNRLRRVLDAAPLCPAG